MKKIYLNLTIIIIPALTILFSACGNFLENYLEKPDGADVTEDTIFSLRVKAEPFLWETYRQIVPSGFPLPSGSMSNFQMPRSISADLCDEAKTSIGASPSANINKSGWGPNNNANNEDRWAQNWIGIRMAYIFMERINDVRDIPAFEKEQMIAECKTLIALRYLRMFKRYGGLPLLTKRLNPDDELAIPRSSIDETVKFIVNLCDEAINSSLPDEYPTKWRGRVTKGVAYAVKSETLLFAASPLFNSERPYMDYDFPELICYGNYDKNRWKLAADAAEDVITWASSRGNIKLINTGNPFDDYGTAVSQQDNQEIIFAYKGNTGENGFFQYYVPKLGLSGGWQENHSILFNILPYFYKEDGTEQTWDEKIGETYPFSEYTRKMNELEPRFKQMAWVFGQNAYNNPTVARFRWNYNALNKDTKGVCRLVKFIYRYQNEQYKDWTIFRLAEFYLNYAEAINEFDPNNSKAYDALNIIRQRAGLPQIAYNDSRFNTQSSLRELIRRERAIELYAEDHRPNDLRRWKLPLKNKFWGGPVYGFQFTVNAAKNGYTAYNLYEIENRFWSEKMYLYFIPQAEVNRGIIKQNPGY